MTYASSHSEVAMTYDNGIDGKYKIKSICFGASDSLPHPFIKKHDGPGIWHDLQLFVFLHDGFFFTFLKWSHTYAKKIIDEKAEICMET